MKTIHQTALKCRVPSCLSICRAIKHFSIANAYLAWSSIYLLDCVLVHPFSRIQSYMLQLWRLEKSMMLCNISIEMLKERSCNNGGGWEEFVRPNSIFSFAYLFIFLCYIWVSFV